MATPSSKHNLGATPTHLTSSPRPVGGSMARPLAHKSPAARTPSASGPGHAHQPSTSSHQYSTPLAAMAGIDDPVAFSSPSAMLALGGYTGISPSPAANSGLMPHGMNENEMQALGMSGLKMGATRNNEEERRRHIGDVVQILRSRVAGRGVCREGVERLSQLEGFESIWQENSLNVAGNFVDLEIEFHPKPNADTVKDVRLSYVTPEASEGEKREEASAVLQGNLLESVEDKSKGIWRSMQSFHANLRWLATLDKLSQEVNCFEAIEGLHASLQRIWDEESNLPRFTGQYDHLCKGWVGRPCMHRNGRIGLALEYWVQQSRVLDARESKPANDAMVIDQPTDRATSERPDAGRNVWTIKIECEEGYPSLRVSKDWVGSSALVPATTAETSSISSSSPPSDSEAVVVNWADPPATAAMAVDSGLQEPATPNRRFVARLDPPLDVPILAASDIYRHVDAQLTQEFRMVAFDGLLVPGLPTPSVDGTPGPASENLGSRRQRRVQIMTPERDGKRQKKEHLYSFQSFESVPGRTLQDIPFSHPRQLADIIPILRQYACLATIVRKIFSPNTTHAKGSESTGSSEKGDHNPASKTPAPSAFSAKDGLMTLSNSDPNEDRLNDLLNSSTHSPSVDKLRDGNHEVKVDVTLRTQLGQAPIIMVLFPVSKAQRQGRDESRQSSEDDVEDVDQVSITFEIGLNGRVSVVDSTGLRSDGTGTGVETTSDMRALDDQKQKALELNQRMARVLETSHDIGILVEWVLRWLGAM